ncbi:MAG: ABC transporter ATP-binding protein [Lachnospiraceae bacterium]|nr:ABC transporter ATP-binding protein [Candidatus Darwinimomas equi]
MLELRNIKKTYGNYHALNGLDLSIPKGSLFGLVGPNGAGKTTAIKIISGLLLPDSGEVVVDGIDALSGRDKVNEIIGYVPDSFGIYDNLTVSEYMEFFAAAYGMEGLKARKRCTNLLGQVGLEDKTDFHVNALSRGMQQRLCLARALIHDPELLIMDEPTSGLDPRTRFEFKELIRDLHDAGKTILVSSHILSELSQICTDIGIMENGSMVLSGGMEDIMTRIESSNPIRIVIMNGVRDTIAILKRNPSVKTISQNGKMFVVNFDGTREDEAALLEQLISADIPVREFVREPGSLESYFMQITDHTEEKVIMENDY